MPEASEIKEEEANEVTQPITDKESNKFAKIIRAKNKINIFSLKPRLSIQTGNYFHKSVDQFLFSRGRKRRRIWNIIGNAIEYSQI